MERQEIVFDYLNAHGIRYATYTHPEAPTIEIAKTYWHDDGSKHCKNLFFRNHKGNHHYLVVFEEYVRRTLAEIYDPSVAFRQCEDAATCKYCDFKSICRR